MAPVTIKDVTVKDRILLHLARFTSVEPGQEYNVPFDLTQDGIAMVVGITRSHASLDLKKLGESGMITNWQAHQKGVRTRRLVYTITPAGIEKADATRDRLMKEGIDIDVILDMKKCDPMTKWNSLSPEDREVFGKVCVLRVPIPRDTFPPTPTGTLPADIFGMINLPPEVARAYLEKVPPEDVRRWNGWAADWWLEHDNPQERLHHLMEAGRTLEACRLCIKNQDEFLSNPNEDLLAHIDRLSCTGGMEEELVWMKCQIAVSCKQLEMAKKSYKELTKFKTPKADVVLSQICMMREDYEQAFDLASHAYDCLHTPLCTIIMAQACIGMNELKSAEELTVEACEAMNRIGDAKDIDEILRVRAQIAYLNDDKERAIALLGKAKAAAPKYKKELIENLMESIQKPGKRVSFS